MEQTKNLLKEIKEDAELQSINGGAWYHVVGGLIASAWGGNMDCGGKDFYKKTKPAPSPTGYGSTRR